MTLRHLPALLVPFLGGCFGILGGDDSAALPAECGDIDGEDGEVPNVTGNWSSIFGTQLFRETCEVDDLDQTSEGWINGAAMYIGGYVPDGLYATFGSEPDERFTGIIDPNGGIVFSGRHDHTQGEMHVAFGGLVYHDPWRDRDVIEGFAFLGLDLDGDGGIDCDARGQWQATKSGI